MMNMDQHPDHMKKKAAAEALHELIQQMMGLEGKKPEVADAMEESTESPVEKALEAKHPEMEAAEGEDGGMDQEKKDFMSFKKKPMIEKKSMTVVMASPKFKKKSKGM